MSLEQALDGCARHMASIAAEYPDCVLSLVAFEKTDPNATVPNITVHSSPQIATASQTAAWSANLHKVVSNMVIALRNKSRDAEAAQPSKFEVPTPSVN